MSSPAIPAPCPRCGSRNLKPTLEVGHDPPVLWKCQRCGANLNWDKEHNEWMP